MGVHWTVVCSQFCGMASIVVGEKMHGEDLIDGAGNLEKIPALELAQRIFSENTLESSIGLAALNSLIPPPTGNIRSINVFQWFADNAKGKSVAIFGHFPHIDDIRKKARELIVFELVPSDGEYPLDKIPELLPSADMVAITSNTIINHTLDQILPFVKAGAFSAMVGPSTPLSPVLFDYGFSMLAGVRVTSENLLLKSISQGAIFRQVKGVGLITYMK